MGEHMINEFQNLSLWIRVDHTDLMGIYPDVWRDTFTQIWKCGTPENMGHLWSWERTMVSCRWHTELSSVFFFYSQSSLYSALLVFYPHLSWTVACLFLDLSQWQALLILFPSISFINTFSWNKGVLLVLIHRRTLASCLLFSQLTPWGPWTSLLSVLIFASVPCCMDLLAHHSEEE